MSAPTHHARSRSVLRFAAIGVVVIFGLFAALVIAESLDPGWNALIVLIAMNSVVVYVADHVGTPRTRLIRMMAVGAVVTLVQPVALLAFWAYSANGNGWFVPLLVAAVVTVVLAALRSKRGYAVAVVVGNVNAVVAAFVVLVSIIPPS